MDSWLFEIAWAGRCRSDYQRRASTYMTRMLIIAAVFSCVYFVELLVCGIGTFKEGGGRGFSYCFLAVVLALWVGFFLHTENRVQIQDWWLWRFCPGAIPLGEAGVEDRDCGRRARGPGDHLNPVL